MLLTSPHLTSPLPPLSSPTILSHPLSSFFLPSHTLSSPFRSSDRLARAEKDLEQSTAELKREAQRSNVRHEEEVKALKSNSAALLEASEKKTETMKKEISDLLVSGSSVIW